VCGRRCTHDNAGGNGDEAAAVGVGDDVAVADGLERDHDEPEGVQVRVVFGLVVVAEANERWEGREATTERVPLALGEHPGHGEPEGEHEAAEHGERVVVHERLEHEGEVHRDAVQRGDAARGGVLELATVHRSEPARQVQAQEHRHRQQRVQRRVHQLHALVLRRQRHPLDRDVVSRGTDSVTKSQSL